MYRGREHAQYKLVTSYQKADGPCCRLLCQPALHQCSLWQHGQQQQQQLFMVNWAHWWDFVGCGVYIADHLPSIANSNKCS